MSITMILAIVAFVVLFSAWVIIPSKLKKRHEDKVESHELN